MSVVESYSYFFSFLEKVCKDGRLDSPCREYRFHVDRRWRFDFAIPDVKLAFEVEGGTWVSGRHTRGSGHLKDMEKYNTASFLGWVVIRLTPEQAKDVQYISDVMLEKVNKFILGKAR